MQKKKKEIQGLSS